MAGTASTTPTGVMGSTNLNSPYVPNFNSTPAKTTEPAVGASVWAKGNQVCTGNNGTLTAKPANMAIMTQNCSVAERSTEAKAVNAGMSKLHPPLASANRQAT